MSEQVADEARTFDDNVESWAADHDGEFVLIRGTAAIGFLPTYAEALETGYERYGLTPFFVRQVRHPPRPHLITRLVAPARADRPAEPPR